MTRTLSFFAFATALLLLSSGACNKPENGDGPDNPGSNPDGEGIEAVDGKVRFYLTYAENSTRTTMGLDYFTSCKIQVNNKNYIPARDEKGAWFIDVEENSGKNYNAVRLGTKSNRWHAGTAFQGVIIPQGQFAGSHADFADFPCYAQYTESNGNKLVFSDAFALLELTVKGAATLTSVEAMAPGGEALSGRGSYLPSKGNLVLSEPNPRAVLNCAPKGKGVALTDKGTRFLLVVQPGSYKEGLRLTFCDSDHRMYRETLPTFTLKAGEVRKVDVNYKPADDLVWFEGFDRFVWGGDLMGGAGGFGFAPDAQKPDINGIATRTGSEYALTSVPYDTPGSGFIQTNNWEEVSGKTVATSHITSDDYLLSRGLQDYQYLFRCQEYQGMLVIGAATAARGILKTPCFTNLKGFNTVKVSFKFCLHSGFNDDILMEFMNGGMLTEVKLDGQTLETGMDKFKYSAASSIYVARGNKISIPASLAEKKTWHTVEATLERATDGLCLYLAGNSSSTGNHGIYLDDLTVTRIGEPDIRKGNLRLLYWNIQNGMWADQANNYDNFVAWVRKYDPDICVWCEASSIYANNTATSTSNRYLPNNWAALAARYGHSHAALGGKRDNYPQEITSKYPVKTILAITDTDVKNKPVSHGAAIQEVDVNGRKIYFVTCHMWPQAYGFGVTGDANREASKARNEGDLYREYEMEYIVSHTVNDAKYAGQQDWILLGDLNSRSRVDNHQYNYAENSTAFLTQDVVRNKTDLKDVIAETYPGRFFTSTMGSARIDYVYASPSMFARIEQASILMDKWTNAHPSKYYSSFYDPSDHRPIIIDFDINK